jgi:4-hydroxy-tetrahydrodipicolinate synthase
VSLRGVYSVMVTPFDAAGGLDLPALADYADWQVREGIHGLIPLGSTGEFLSLTEAEREAVAGTVIDAVAGRVPVLVGAGAERTEDAMAAARRARALGAQGVMVIPPFYCTPTPRELFVHYRRIADAAQIPVMLYNNPATANVDLTPEIVASLSKIDGVDYIKDSTLEVTRVRDILDLCGDRMTVFGGILGYESFVMGAAGWVAVVSNLAPARCAAMFERTMAGDHAGARALYAELLPLIRLVGGHRYVSATKAALGLMGRPVGEPRSPRLPADEAEVAAARAALAPLDMLASEPA